MQAILVKQAGGPEQLELGIWPIPVPKPKQILVKVAATALNRADLLQREGKYPPPPGASPLLGLEMAGVVEQIGSEVSSWQAGDRVCGLLPGGGYAEYAVLHEDMALAVPDNMPFTTAAAIPEAFLTAFQALIWLANIQEKETVLIHAGASGVGTAAIQLARLAKAEAWVTASAPKHAVCRKLGASLTIDYKKKSFAEVIQAKKAGAGVNVILDFVGGPYLADNLNSLALDGRLVQLGLMGGASTQSFSLGPVLRKRLRILGSTLRNRPKRYKINLTRAFASFAWAAIEAGHIAPVIDSIMPWQEVAQAHRNMAANLNTGKIVLAVNS